MNIEPIVPQVFSEEWEKEEAEQRDVENPLEDEIQ